MKRLWLIQAAGNALLFWCAFTWLGIRDSRNAQLLETAVFGLLILASWLWLQDGTLSYCGDRSQGLVDGIPQEPQDPRHLCRRSCSGSWSLCWALGKLEAPSDDGRSTNGILADVSFAQTGQTGELGTRLTWQCCGDCAGSCCLCWCCRLRPALPATALAACGVRADACSGSNT